MKNDIEPDLIAISYTSSDSGGEWFFRDIFRTQSNIFDGALSALSEIYQLLAVIFAKKLHHTFQLDSKYVCFFMYLYFLYTFFNKHKLISILKLKCFKK